MDFTKRASQSAGAKLTQKNVNVPNQAVASGSKSANVPKPKPKKSRKRPAPNQRINIGMMNDGDFDDENDDPNQIKIGNVEDDKAEDQMNVAETYADYKPTKLKIGKPHPDPVVETASLSSVEPGEITYELALPEETIDEGHLSALQLESIVYASQAHAQHLPDGTRAGFLIGDGAGVGKGRTVAGIIFENYLHGRKKAIWISVSNDLFYDAQRDLNDIGAGYIPVNALNKLEYAKIDGSTNKVPRGVVFSTYSSLISGTNRRGVNTKFNTRLKQLVEWAGGDKFDGVIVFDECHKAKHLVQSGSAKPTKTGLNVLELQTQLPNARVVYASATGASEPRNMAYMVRLGLWGAGTPFKNFAEFLRRVERGVSVMEIVAMDMKLRGMYIARQLSFKGATFTVTEVPLTDEFKQVYNDSVKLWVEALHNFNEAAAALPEDDLTKKITHTWSTQFWSAHQRFFKYLCIASKVNDTVEIAKKAVKDGKCVVIGLQSTGEARTLDVLEREDGELSEFISTAKSVFETLVENHFPAPDRAFVDDLTNANKPKATKKEKKEKKPEKEAASSLKQRGQKLKRRASGRIASTASAKKRRIIAPESDSDDDNAVITFDDDSDGASHRSGSSAKSKATSKGKKPLKIESDSDERSGADSDAYSGSGSGSDSSSNSGSGDESDESNYSDSGSDGSLIDSDEESDSYDEDDDDSESGMVYPSRGRPAKTTAKITAKTTGKASALREKVHESLKAYFLMMQKAPPGVVQGSMMNPANFHRFCDMRDDLLMKINELGKRLPPNTLDQLIDELGGPSEVAEMTGRKGRVVQTDCDDIQYESRGVAGISLEKTNLHEKDQFMAGEKLIAIISEAASNGISLQSDRRVKNQRRRVHITLELPWSADRAIQQFGRSHRSNQVNAPEYIFLISDLAGERRFASSVSKRLESLGALTHADRRATETRNLSQFNFDNKYGRTALQTVFDNVIGANAKHFRNENKDKAPLFDEIRDALDGVGLDGPVSKIEIPRFLNRILGLPVDLQNLLFEHFADTLDEEIYKAKKAGRYDLGILDLGSSEKVEKIRSVRFQRKHATGVAPIEITTVSKERGISWEEVQKHAEKVTNSFEGFYLGRRAGATGKRVVFLALTSGTEMTDEKIMKRKPHSVPFLTLQANLGMKYNETLEDIQRRATKITAAKAEQHWTDHYESALKRCHHVFWHGRCLNKNAGFACDSGMRKVRYTVVSGSIFAVWERIEHFCRSDDQFQRIRMVRVRTSDDKKIVGVLLPEDQVEDLIESFENDVGGKTVDSQEQSYVINLDDD